MMDKMWKLGGGMVRLNEKGRGEVGVDTKMRSGAAVGRCAQPCSRWQARPLQSCAIVGPAKLQQKALQVSYSRTIRSLAHPVRYLHGPRFIWTIEHIELIKLELSTF